MAAHGPSDLKLRDIEEKIVKAELRLAELAALLDAQSPTPPDEAKRTRLVAEEAHLRSRETQLRSLQLVLAQRGASVTQQAPVSPFLTTLASRRARNRLATNIQAAAGASGRAAPARKRASPFGAALCTAVERRVRRGRGTCTVRVRHGFAGHINVGCFFC